jgi:hypothetical protein
VGDYVAWLLDNYEDPITGLTTPEKLRATSLKWRKDDLALTARREQCQNEAATARRKRIKSREMHERFALWFSENKIDGRPIFMSDYIAWCNSTAA